jgi:hypothetical protein
MFIEFIQNKNRYMVELWSTDQDDFTGFKEPYPEDEYIHINNWCVQNLGYHARTAYNRFEFKKDSDLTMFVLRWSNET